MAHLAQLSSALTDWRSLVSAAAGLFVLAAATFYARRRVHRHGAERTDTNGGAGAKPRPARAAAVQGEERRTQPRWLTRKIRVSVADADSRKVLGVATIYDRSIDGVRLVGNLSLATGARLYICPAAPGEKNEWANIEVRYCKRSDEGWVLGCRFTQPLSWDMSARLG